MRAFVAAGLVAGLVGLAGTGRADDKAADPVGKWKCEYEIGDQKRTSTLTVKKDGEKYAGTMAWPDQKEAKLTDVTLKNGELSFTAVREFMDQKITIKYKLKFDGDKLKGKGAADFGGESREFDIEGKREKKDDK